MSQSLPARTRSFTVAKAVALACLAVCLGAINVSQAVAADATLDIYWIDTEGGAATLIVTPQRETILIDAGNPGRRDSNRIFKALTETVGAKKLDHLFVTHYHVDHFGGANDLSKLIPIGHIHDNGQFAGMPEKPDRAYADLKCEQRSVVNPGDRLELKQPAAKDIARLEVRCLATRQQVIAAEDAANAAAPANDAVCKAHHPKDRDGSDNANSVVLLVSFGDFRFFDAGDLTWNVEQKLVCPKNLVGSVDVYQTTHHGLEASNNPVVLASLTPTVAIMNNGARKGSDAETVATLKATKSLESVYQLHKNVRDGGIHNVAPDEHIANVDEKCEGNLIHLRVAADGKSYTVSIPSKKHERTYKTQSRSK